MVAAVPSPRPGRANRFSRSRPGEIGICSRQQICMAAGWRRGFRRGGVLDFLQTGPVVEPYAGQRCLSLRMKPQTGGANLFLL